MYEQVLFAWVKSCLKRTILKFIKRLSWKFWMKYEDVDLDLDSGSSSLMRIHCWSGTLSWTTSNCLFNSFPAWRRCWMKDSTSWPPWTSTTSTIPTPSISSCFSRPSSGLRRWRRWRCPSTTLSPTGRRSWTKYRHLLIWTFPIDEFYQTKT